MTVTTAPALATLNPRELLRAQVKWRHLETLFWLATLLPFLVAPTYLILGSQIAIAALFALSLDLIVGYAGLVSLGHAAFFGFGAYTAGLIAKAGWGEPITGLLAAAFAAMVLGYLTSFIIVRISHFALIMVTLGLCLLLYEVANKAHWLTGGDDGLQGVRMWPLLGMFRFDLYGRTAFAYSLVVLFGSFLILAPADQFTVRALASRHSGKRAPHAGDRLAEQQPNPDRLHHLRDVCRNCRRFAGADDRVRRTRRA